MAPAMSTPLPVLYSDFRDDSTSTTRPRSALRSSFGKNKDTPTESLRHLRSTSFGKNGSPSSTGTATTQSSTQSLRSSLESNGRNNNRLSMMLQSKGATSSASRRRSTRSITSLPVTSKEERKAVKEVKAKKSAQELAKQRLAEQQKQAMKRQAEKRGNTLDDFLSKEDDDSLDSDDDDMFSFLQWSATGSEATRSQSVGRAGRSRSAPRIRLSSSSVVSLLSESQSKAKELRKSASENKKSKELRRSISVPKTREDLEASMGTLHTQTLTSLYGTNVNKNKATRSLSITKDESKESPSIERQRTRKTSVKDDRLAGGSRRNRDDKERASSRLRSVRQLRQEEANRHNSDRKDSGDKRSHKSSSRKTKRRESKDDDDDKSRRNSRKSKRRSSKDDDDEKSRSSRHKSRRGRNSDRKPQEEERSRRRSKSRRRLQEGDESSQHWKRSKSQSRRRHKEGEESRRLEKVKKRLSKSSIEDSPKSKSDDGHESRHSRRHSKERHRSSHRHRKSPDSETLEAISAEHSPHSKGSRSSHRSKSTGRRHSEEVGDHQPLCRSVSIRRRSDSEALLKSASQLILVDEEIDHRAISDGEDSSSDLQGRKSYFSKPVSSGRAPDFHYPKNYQEESNVQPKAAQAPPRRTLEQQPSTFQSLRSMLPNLNLADEA